MVTTGLEVVLDMLVFPAIFFFFSTTFLHPCFREGEYFSSSPSGCVCLLYNTSAAYFQATLKKTGYEHEAATDNLLFFTELGTS